MGDKSADTGAVLKYVQAKKWGFMTLTIDSHTISGATIEVDRSGHVSNGDTFSYPHQARHPEIAEIGSDAVRPGS
ncbi:MAG: type VI secretion system baseplate subunit TssK [Xanthobacteraceae bacterium]